MTTDRIPGARPSLTLADALPHARSSAWLTHHSPSAFLAAAGLLATTGTLVITEDRIGVTLFPAALTALSMGAIALAAAVAMLSLALGLFLRCCSPAPEPGGPRSQPVASISPWWSLPFRSSCPPCSRSRASG
jgi:hypothetical protein